VLDLQNHPIREKEIV